MVYRDPSISGNSEGGEEAAALLLMAERTADEEADEEGDEMLEIEMPPLE